MVDFWTYAFLCASAFLAGVMNSVAGGGTLLTFPALTGALAPLGVGAAAMANGTSTVALLPGSFAGALGYRKELWECRRFVFRMLAPEGSRSGAGVDVYYIHKFSVNGVYLGNRMAFVQETAKLRPVPGGIDEPLPRVTAHELGHALGLPHRQDRTNLLASGTTGTILNEAEVARSREKARSTPGSLPVADLRKKAEEAAAKGEVAEARRLWGWLAEVPGEGADEARKRLEALPTAP